MKYVSKPALLCACLHTCSRWTLLCLQLLPALELLESPLWSVCFTAGSLGRLGKLLNLSAFQLITGPMNIYPTCLLGERQPEDKSHGAGAWISQLRAGGLPALAPLQVLVDMAAYLVSALFQALCLTTSPEGSQSLNSHISQMILVSWLGP
jgi:hypothetical protein